MTDTTATSFGADIGASFQRLQEERQSGLRAGVAQLRAIFAWLRIKHPELKRIEIGYDGAGDGGQVESIYFSKDPSTRWGKKLEVDDSEVLPDEINCGHTSRDGRWDPVKREWIHTSPGRNESISEALDRIGWDIAYGQNPGFEINEGGFGTVAVFLDEGLDESDVEVKVELQHSERVEVTNDYSYDF